MYVFVHAAFKGMCLVMGRQSICICYCGVKVRVFVGAALKYMCLFMRCEVYSFLYAVFSICVCGFSIWYIVWVQCLGIQAVNMVLHLHVCALVVSCMCS